MRLRFLAVGAWLAFTIALAVWWYILGVRLVEHAVGSSAFEHAKRLSMLWWEGLTLVVSLIVGGGAIIYYMQRELREKHRTEEFFSTFTHELRTPLASITLQAESLAEDLKDSGHNKIVSRLVSDAQRLTHQLENSLLLAQLDRYEPALEPIKVSEVVHSLAHRWPKIELKLSGDATIHTDRRVLTAAFDNVVANALAHGGASEVTITISNQEKATSIVCQDNGRGFSGSREEIGGLFHRPTRTSGNGIGLHLSKVLLRRCRASVSFPAPAYSAPGTDNSTSNRTGFLVAFSFPKTI